MADHCKVLWLHALQELAQAGSELVLGAVQLRCYLGSSVVHRRSLVSGQVSHDAEQWNSLHQLQASKVGVRAGEGLGSREGRFI